MNDPLRLGGKLSDDLFAASGSSWLGQRAAMLENRITVLLAVVVILFYRKPDAFLNPQFWAEDGCVFFKENLELGWRAIFHTYAGYLHFVPRVVAWLAGYFPVAYAPCLYNLAALLVTLLVAWRLMSYRLPLRYKGACALSTVLVVHSGEVFLTITNIQWLTALLLIFLLIAEEPRTGREWIADFVTLAVAGLTGPFVIMFAPLFAFRFLRYGRSRYNWSLLAAVVLVASVHAYFFWVDRAAAIPIGGQAVGLGVVGSSIRKMLYSSVNGMLLLGGPGAGQFSLSSIMLVAAIVAWLVIVWEADRRRLCLQILLLLISTLIVAGAAYKYRYEIDLLKSICHYPVGDRYFYLPRLMVVWGLLLALEAGSWRQVSAKALLGLCLLGSACNFRAPEQPDFKWQQYADRIGRAETVDVPIPPDWTLHLSARPQSGWR
jgi:hypothetical protein